MLHDGYSLHASVNFAGADFAGAGAIVVVDVGLDSQPRGANAKKVIKAIRDGLNVFFIVDFD